jgi:hypothetical protein
LTGGDITSAIFTLAATKVRLKNNTKRRKNRIAMSAIYNKKKYLQIEDTLI